MTKPITLFIPKYYDKKVVNGNRLLLTKTKPLVTEDRNNAKVIATIEKIENYKCAIPEIEEEYREIATNCFNRDLEEGWELPVKVNNRKVYTYHWDDKAYHFRIYRILISEHYMLQLANIVEPKYSSFYKNHFALYFQAIEIDTTANFGSQNNADELFECKSVEVATEELQKIISIEKQKEDKAKFLKENLRVSNPNFYAVLEAELNKKQEVTMESFICTDWNMYYDLYNPENFSDPDSTVEWEDNAGVYEYYKKPYTDNTRVSIVHSDKVFYLNTLKNLIANAKTAEQNLLSFFEHYTFGNGGAYADGIHYKWAKIEIERLHNTSYTNQEFLKRNLCLCEIILSKNSREVILYFKCSWDTEHGISILLNEKYECKIEE